LFFLSIEIKINIIFEFFFAILIINIYNLIVLITLDSLKSNKNNLNIKFRNYYSKEKISLKEFRF